MQRLQFFSSPCILQGYVIVEDYFDKEKELDPVRDAITVLVEELAQKLFDAGKIKST